MNKPAKFGLERDTKNGAPFDVRIVNRRIVWIKPSQSSPLSQDWIKTVEGLLNLRNDRNGKPYALIEGVYIGQKYLSGLSQNDKVKVVAVKQDDGRWSAIAVAGLR